MHKEKFTEPIMEIVRIDGEDVIATSPGNPGSFEEIIEEE